MDFGNEMINISKIRDGLFIGDRTAATTIDIIFEFKISHMINTASNQIPSQFMSLGIKYLSFNWPEFPPQHSPIIKDDLANKILKFIDSALRNGDGIMVYSVKGQNRVCVVVILYLMKKYFWSLEKCLDYLHSKKPDMHISKNFLDQLFNYEIQLQKLNPKRIKSIDWSNNNLKDKEELVMRNTYINEIELRKKKCLNDSVKKDEKRHVGWADKNDVGNFINFDIDKDLFLKKNVENVTVHIGKHYLKSAIKNYEINNNINIEDRKESNIEEKENTNENVKNTNNDDKENNKNDNKKIENDIKDNKEKETETNINKTDEDDEIFIVKSLVNKNENNKIPLKKINENNKLANVDILSNKNIDDPSKLKLKFINDIYKNNNKQTELNNNFANNKINITYKDNNERNKIIAKNFYNNLDNYLEREININPNFHKNKKHYNNFINNSNNNLNLNNKSNNSYSIYLNQNKSYSQKKGNKTNNPKNNQINNLVPLNNFNNNSNSYLIPNIMTKNPLNSGNNQRKLFIKFNKANNFMNRFLPNELNYIPVLNNMNNIPKSINNIDLNLIKKPKTPNINYNNNLNINNYNPNKPIKLLNVPIYDNSLKKNNSTNSNIFGHRHNKLKNNNLGIKRPSTAPQKDKFPKKNAGIKFNLENGENRVMRSNGFMGNNKRMPSPMVNNYKCNISQRMNNQKFRLAPSNGNNIFHFKNGKKNY